MPASFILAIGLLAAYLLFLGWYGGRSRPLTAAEGLAFRQALQPLARTPQELALLDRVEELAAHDDGHEFVMFNLVYYRAQALYPPGHPAPCTSAREADLRYGRAIVPLLLKRACVPVFIARRSGRFAEVEGAPDWHYIALVRYRSRRDFLRFALEIEQRGMSVHKWAAIEQTHIFPVQAVVSAVFVRGAVGLLFLTVWAAAAGVMR